MSLDAAKLENVRELAGGIVQARCPACAEDGHDRTGEHLRIYPDGRFGCCVHPKDKEHRKRIFALAGRKLHRSSPGTFTVRIKTSAAGTTAKSVKAALVISSLPAPSAEPRHGGQSPAPASTGDGLGTLGTPETELENGVRGVRAVSPDDSRTPRTGISELRTRARVDSTGHIDIGGDFQEKLKDWESGVRGVRSVVEAVAGERLPYLTPGGTLVIPFDSPERYHWWKPDGERLTVAETLAEVRAGLANEERMKHAVTV